MCVCDVTLYVPFPQIRAPSCSSPFDFSFSFSSAHNSLWPRRPRSIEYRLAHASHVDEFEDHAISIAFADYRPRYRSPEVRALSPVSLNIGAAARARSRARGQPDVQMTNRMTISIMIRSPRSISISSATCTITIEAYTNVTREHFIRAKKEGPNMSKQKKKSCACVKIVWVRGRVDVGIENEEKK